MTLIIVSLFIASIVDLKALAPPTALNCQKEAIICRKKKTKFKLLSRNPIDEERQPLLQDDQLSISSTPESQSFYNYGTITPHNQTKYICPQKTKKLSSLIKKERNKITEKLEYAPPPASLQLIDKLYREECEMFRKAIRYGYIVVVFSAILFALIGGLSVIFFVPDTIELIKTLSTFLLIILIITLFASLLLFILYKTVKTPKPQFPQIDIHTDDIEYKQQGTFTIDIFLTEENIKQINSHFSSLPHGSYTVLKQNDNIATLIAKKSEKLLLVFEIPLSKAENFTYAKKILQPYLNGITVFNPFTLDTHKNLKSEPIVSGAGVGFELQGCLFFSFKNISSYEIQTADIPGRGLTHIPSFFKTVSSPQVAISFDVQQDLELITDPIKYSIPSERKETKTLVSNFSQTWKELEKEASYRKKPLTKILNKITKKTNIIYERSKDKNNTLPSESIYLYLTPFHRRPVLKNLQCTYSIPIETFSSPVLSWFDRQDKHRESRQKAQQLIQEDLIETLESCLGEIKVHDLKKLEGFFTALFYLLKHYKQPHLYSPSSVLPSVYSKYFMELYIKHNIYDLFSLLPTNYQNFLTTLSQTPNNTLYLSIAKHLRVQPYKSHYLSYWYLYGRGGNLPKTITRTNYSLSELLDILFQRKNDEKLIWFIDDLNCQLTRNEDDTTHENTRFLVELRGIPSCYDASGDRILDCTNHFIKLAGYLSGYNSTYHLFESSHSIRNESFVSPRLLKSA